MKNLNFWKSSDEPGENALASAGIIKVIVFLILIGVVVYSEYMFIGIISVILPDGVNKVGALIGAVATGASVLTLIAAKLLWITPGGQMVWSWIFTGCEVAILILNDMLAYALHYGAASGFLAGWQQITPASPVFALIGWILILLFDRAQRERHQDMELESKKARAERRYKEAAHKAEMELRGNHLNQVTGRLQEVLASDAIQQQIMKHAEQMVARVLTDVSGITSVNYTPSQQQQFPPAQQLPASFAQQSSTPAQSPEKDLHDWLYTYLGSNDAGRTPFLTWLEEHNRGIPINPATMALARRMYPLPLDVQQNGHKVDDTAFPNSQQK